MCGFLGVIGDYHEGIKDRFKLAFNSINHRGPDSSGIFESKDLLLGHKRLSIIDLDKRSDQPFSDGKSTLLFNGEIYNYQYLRDKLIADYDCIFKTGGDTEVLFYGLKYEGSAFIPKIDGMFSIFYTSGDGKAILTRDQFGQKPLFYSFYNNQSLIFCSELLPIIDLIGKKDLSVNRDAFKEYLQFGASIAPSTFYSEIAQVCPGQVISICVTRGIIEKEFWTGSATKIEGKNDIKRALSTRLKSCFVADTPIAILSSGGIDSSALIKVSSSLQINPPTIAVHLKTVEDERGSKIAMKMNSAELPLVSIESRVKDIYTKDQSVQFLLDRFGEPFADTSYFYSEQLYSAIPNDYKVIIGGDGADEVFLGYKPAIYFYLSSIMTRIIPGVLRKFLIKHIHNSGRIGVLISVLLGCRESSEKALMGFSSYDISCLELGKVNSSKVHPEILSGQQVIDFYETYLMTRLSNVFLRKSDHASMRFSKELRSPYLQGDLADFRSMRNLMGKIIPKFNLKAFVSRTIGIREAFRQKVGFDVLAEQKKESSRQDILEWTFKNKALIEHLFNFDHFVDLVKRVQKNSHLFRIQVLLHWVQGEYKKEQ